MKFKNVILETETDIHQHQFRILPFKGSTISTEPMYIIMNTAISTEWGFPSKCPGGCPCKDYDCNSKKFGETCGFSAHFCDMMTNKTNIPTYNVNWVRVYQDPDNPKQKVGCSTPERPSKTYIKAHEEKYKTVDDVSLYAYARARTVSFQFPKIHALPFLATSYLSKTLGKTAETNCCRKWDMQDESKRHFTRFMWRCGKRSLHACTYLRMSRRMDRTTLSCSCCI